LRFNRCRKILFLAHITPLSPLTFVLMKARRKQQAAPRLLQFVASFINLVINLELPLSLTAFGP
jgi:hypothetical protein